MYGDVFGTAQTDENDTIVEPIDTVLWGEMESEESEEEEDEEVEDEEAEAEKDNADDTTGLVTPAMGGLVTPSGMVSMPAGMETPDIIELRKRKIESEMENTDNPQLYQILQEKKTDKLRKDIMASTHTYDLTGLRKKGAVDIALNPNELESIDAAGLAAKYDETVKKQQESMQKEDLSDMVANHVAKQKRKQKDTGSSSTDKQKKKYKEFKF